MIVVSCAAFQLLRHRAASQETSTFLWLMLGPHSLSWGRHQRNFRFKVKLWTLGMNQKNQPHICLLEKNVLLGLAVKISWVNAGIYRVSFLVALMDFKIFNS